MDRKTIASWCLFDFANSFYAVLPAVIWQTYYQQQVVVTGKGEGALWWGYAISASMLIVALTSPVMGAVADYAGLRKRLLVFYTVLCVFFVCLYTTVEPGMVVWGFVVTVVSYVGFEGGLVFYNAYLPEIAPREYQGRVSGWGFATGYVGSLCALLLSIPLAQRGMLNAAFIFIAAAFLFLSLPAFFNLPADGKAKLDVKSAAQAGLRESWNTFRDILRLRDTRRFLLAYFFYEDGVNTVINMSAGFAASDPLLNFQTHELLLLFAVVQVSALIGAFLWARPTDRLGPKRVVSLVLVQWSAVVIAAYFVQSKTQFFVVAVLAGTGMGAIQAASRAFMSTLIPKGREADFFGFYSLCGKSAAVMGPIIFGHVAVAAGGSQRVAIFSIMALYIIGGFLLRRVQAGGPTFLPTGESRP
ncbi:MAG: MFS transporter [Acidobacteria bacterium]|nr:MFS transporter [Acidobacteriota bacterium]MCL5289271.1 MFS transporter [Acidobacteriota bacterium]